MAVVDASVMLRRSLSICLTTAYVCIAGALPARAQVAAGEVTGVVKDQAGAVTRWRFEGYPPNMLVRQGWKRDETLMPGATVTVDGWASRDDATLGAVRWITFEDGKKLAGGPPAGTGGR